MNFIKLKTFSGNNFYLNVDAICSFARVKHGIEFWTEISIIMSEKEYDYRAQETPEEILNLIYAQTIFGKRTAKKKAKA